MSITIAATSGFRYTENRLTCQGLALADLARQYGTPLWVYDGDQIASNYQAIQAAFSSLGAQICYAVKANDALCVMNLLASLSAGFDVVSGGELKRALKVLGGHGETIVFAGAAKTDEELEMALAAGIQWINVESLAELCVIEQLATKLGVMPNVALRIAPGIDPHTDAHISTGHIGTKFGIEIPVAEEILSAYHVGEDFQHMILGGIQCHVGSQIHDPQVYGLALDKVLPLFKQFGWLWSLDLGGGLPVAYGRPDEEMVLPYEAFAKVIGEKIEAANLSPKFQLIIEPGRSLVANAGVLIVEVQSQKMSGPTRIITCDGGMADLVRPAMYGSYHEILPLDHICTGWSLADIAGPHCESSDFLGKDRLMPEFARGALLAVLNAGAYGRTMSSRYNSSRLAAEVMILGGKVKICRRREEYDDAWQNEIW